MNNFILTLTVLLLLGCNSDKTKELTFYKAVKGKDIALVSLTETKSSFYGHFEILYGTGGKDFGKVRGEKIGDTLKGKFNYISYGGSKKIIPFVLLRRGNALKMGSGITATYVEIPFFIPETIKFEDSNFQFHIIDSIALRRITPDFKKFL